MEIERTETFLRYYAHLNRNEQRLVDVKLVLLAENYLHPSLRARKWRRPNTWYARVTRDIRLFFEVHDGYYRLTGVGHHDIERAM